MPLIGLGGTCTFSVRRGIKQYQTFRLATHFGYEVLSRAKGATVVLRRLKWGGLFALRQNDMSSTKKYSSYDVFLTYATGQNEDLVQSLIVPVP